MKLKNTVQAFVCFVFGPGDQTHSLMHATEVSTTEFYPQTPVFCCFETGCLYVDLRFIILLLQPPECLDYTPAGHTQLTFKGYVKTNLGM